MSEPEWMKVAVHEGRDYGSWVVVVVVYNKLNLNLDHHANTTAKIKKQNKTKHSAFVFTAALWGTLGTTSQLPIIIVQSA